MQAMSDLWANGNVQITGDLLLEKDVYFAQYYLFTSLPALDPYTPGQAPGQDPGIAARKIPNYGHSRTSLGKGGLGQDYQVMYEIE